MKIIKYKGTIVLTLLIVGGTVLCYHLNGRPLNILSYIGFCGIGLATFYNEYNENRTKE